MPLFSCCTSNDAVTEEPPAKKEEAGWDALSTLEFSHFLEQASALELSHVLEQQAGRAAPKVDQDREIWLPNLEQFDYFVESLKEKRTKSISEVCWSTIREAFASIEPGVFETKPHSYTVKTSEQVQERLKALSWLFPIDPPTLAERTGLALEAVLTELLHAANLGMLKLLWAPICHRCGGASREEPKLASIRREQICSFCGHTNTVESLDQIQALFAWAPEVLPAPVQAYDSHRLPHEPIFEGLVPPSKEDSGLSYVFGVHSWQPPAIPKGRYRLVCPYASVDCFLHVAREPQATPIRMRLKASDMQRPLYGQSQTNEIINLDHGKVRLDLQADTDTMMLLRMYPVSSDREFVRDSAKITPSTLLPQPCLTHAAQFNYPQEQRPDFLSATQVIHHPAFFNLFREQSVSQPLSISNLVLVSAKFTSRSAVHLADRQAWERMNQRHRVLRSCFGRCLHTRGDSVGMAFLSVNDAIEGAEKALRAMQPRRIQLHLAIHQGPVLLVPSPGGGMEYYGNTVNVLAGLETVAEPGECVLSCEVMTTVTKEGDDVIRKLSLEPTSKPNHDALGTTSFMMIKDSDLHS